MDQICIKKTFQCEGETREVGVLMYHRSCYQLVTMKSDIKRAEDKLLQFQHEASTCEMESDSCVTEHDSNFPSEGNVRTSSKVPSTDYEICIICQQAAKNPSDSRKCKPLR